MNYLGNTQNIELLIKRAVAEAFSGLGYTYGQESTGVTPFPLYTTKQLAKIFQVSTFTVRNWVKRGELHPHYQAMSGRCVRLIFTTPDLMDFFDRNFPSPKDISDHPSNPRRGSKATRLIEKILTMNRLYARKRRRTEYDGEG